MIVSAINIFMLSVIDFIATDIAMRIMLTLVWMSVRICVWNLLSLSIYHHMWQVLMKRK